MQLSPTNILEGVSARAHPQPHGDHNFTNSCLCTLRRATDSKNWRSIHNEANLDVFSKLTGMQCCWYGHPNVRQQIRGYHFSYWVCVLQELPTYSVRNIPKLEKDLRELTQQIREQLRRAGVSYGFTFQSNDSQAVEVPTCTTPSAQTSQGNGSLKRSQPSTATQYTLVLPWLLKWHDR